MMAQAIDVDNLTNNFNSISITQIGQVTLSQKNCPQLHYKNHFYKISTAKSCKPEYLRNLKESENLNEIKFPQELLKTLNGEEDFLIYDSGVDDDERIFIFGTSDNFYHNLALIVKY